MSIKNISDNIIINDIQADCQKSLKAVAPSISSDNDSHCIFPDCNTKIKDSTTDSSDSTQDSVKTDSKKNQKKLHPIHNAHDICYTIQQLPDDWVLVPLIGKVPLGNWRSITTTNVEKIEKCLLHGRWYKDENNQWVGDFATGIGVKTGEVSSGLLTTDMDGASAEPILEYILAVTNTVLPKTVCWTSGKPGRYQSAYKIPDKYREEFKEFTRIAKSKWVKDDGNVIECAPKEQIEFRYNGVQSALPPSWHPETGAYYWINSPEDTDIAYLPDAICELLLSINKKTKETITVESKQDSAKNVSYQASDYSGNNLIEFLNEEVLPRLDALDIYNWQGHDFNWTGHRYEGQPYNRVSTSGTGFCVRQAEDGTWIYKDWGDTDCKGGAVQYRWMLKGGSGTPTGADFVEIVRELADEAGVEMPEWKRPHTITPDEQKQLAWMESEEYRKEQSQRDFEESEAFAQIEDERRKKQWIEAKENSIFTRWTKSRVFTPDIKFEAQYVTEDVCPDWLSDDVVFALKSGLGTGKSVFMREVIEYWDDFGSLILGYRNLLGIQTVAELRKNNIDAYHIHKHKDEFEANIKNEKATLSFCVDSLIKFQGREELFKGRSVFIDEIMSVRKHLLYSKHISVSIRNRCLKVLENILKVCRFIVLLDGHCSDAAVRWICELSGRFGYYYDYENDVKCVEGDSTKILNLQPAPQANIKWIVGAYDENYSGETVLDSDNMELPGVKYVEKSGLKSLILNDNGVFGVCSDNRTVLTAYHKKLVEKDPTIPRLLITSETVNNPDVIAFMENPNEEIQEKQYRSIEYTPSAESGFDINIKDYFEREYCDYYGLIDASSAMQMTFRLRDPKIERFISVAPFSPSIKFDGDYDTNARIQRHEAMAVALIRSADTSVFGAEELSIDQLVKRIIEQTKTINGVAAAETAQQTEFETANCRKCLLQLLKEGGHNIDYILVPTDDDAKQAVKDATDEYKEQECKAIVKAWLLLDFEADNIRTKNSGRTPEERAMLTKHSINKRLPGIVSDEAFTWEFVKRIVYSERDMVARLTRFYVGQDKELTAELLSKKTAATIKKMNTDGALLPTDINFNYLKLKALVDAGFFELLELGTWNVKTDKIKEIIKITNTVPFQRAMGYELKKDKNGADIARKLNEQKAMICIAEWLKWLGINTKVVGTEREGTKTIRTYAIKTEYYFDKEVNIILQYIRSKYTAVGDVHIDQLLNEDAVIPFGKVAVEAKDNERKAEPIQLSIFGDLFAPIAA